MSPFEYTLTDPPSPSPTPYGSGAGYLFNGPPTPVTPESLSIDQLLAVARRALGQYADDLEFAGRGGWDALRAFARMWARVSLAIGRFDAETSPASATGPAQATAIVTFQRPTTAGGHVTLLKGSLVRASRSGAVFRTLEDLFFGADVLGPLPVEVIAIGYGEEWNVEGQYMAPDGDILLGEIDTIDMLLQNPVFQDQSFTVRNPAEATGGHLGVLDLHGHDVDLRRIYGEPDGVYSTRITAATDRVSPRAMRRQVSLFMSAIGYTDDDWYLVEIPGFEYLGCYDAIEGSFSFRPEYEPTLFVPDDDIRPASPILNRQVDTAVREAAGVLEIRDLPAFEEWGFAFDDPGLELADFATRALPAPDMEAESLVFQDEISVGRHCAVDGFDAKRNAIFRRLHDLLTTVPAHGVIVELHARGD